MLLSQYPSITVPTFHFTHTYLFELRLLPLVLHDDCDRPPAEEAPALEVHDRPGQQGPLGLEGLKKGISSGLPDISENGSIILDNLATLMRSGPMK